VVGGHGPVQIHDAQTDDPALSELIEDTVGGASVDGGVRVGAALIALLSVLSVDDAIATIGKTAVGTASVGDRVRVEGTVVAFFSGVDHAITAFWELAVFSASVGGAVAVEDTEIALFGGIDISVSTFGAAQIASTSEPVGTVVAFFAGSGVGDSVSAPLGFAVGSASGVGAVAVEGAKIAVFVTIHNTVTANGEFAVGSAGCVWGVGVGATVIAFLPRIVDNSVSAKLGAVGGAPEVEATRIALLIVLGVENTVTTRTNFAVGSASSIGPIAVESSIVALLSKIDLTVTAVGAAGGVTGVVGAVEQGTVVAVLVEIGDAVTTGWQFAVRPAVAGAVSIESSIITLLASIDHTITTESPAAACSASVGESVAIEGSVVTFLDKVQLTVSALLSADA